MRYRCCPLPHDLLNLLFGVEKAGYTDYQYEDGHRDKEVTQDSDFVEEFDLEKGHTRPRKYDKGSEVSQKGAFIGQLGALQRQ